jgi:hypothetical protein
VRGKATRATRIDVPHLERDSSARTEEPMISSSVEIMTTGNETGGDNVNYRLCGEVEFASCGVRRYGRSGLHSFRLFPNELPAHFSGCQSPLRPPLVRQNQATLSFGLTWRESVRHKRPKGGTQARLVTNDVTGGARTRREQGQPLLLPWEVENESLPARPATRAGGRLLSTSVAFARNLGRRPLNTLGRSDVRLPVLSNGSVEARCMEN